MIDNNLKAIICSILCFFVTYLGYSNLSPYIITKENNLSKIINNLLSTMDASTVEKLQVLGYVLFSIAGLILCVMIISYLLSLLRDSSKPLSQISKFSIVMWIVLLAIDILLLIHTLASVVIIIILCLIALLVIASAAISGGGGGGPVHVRGHSRKGSYVRSYTRRRPRSF